VVESNDWQLRATKDVIGRKMISKGQLSLLHDQQTSICGVQQTTPRTLLACQVWAGTLPASSKSVVSRAEVRAVTVGGLTGSLSAFLSTPAMAIYERRIARAF
jgi:hypothetical protein